MREREREREREEGNRRHAGSHYIKGFDWGQLSLFFALPTTPFPLLTYIMHATFSSSLFSGNIIWLCITDSSPLPSFFSFPPLSVIASWLHEPALKASLCQTFFWSSSESTAHNSFLQPFYNTFNNMLQQHIRPWLSPGGTAVYNRVALMIYAYKLRQLLCLIQGLYPSKDPAFEAFEGESFGETLLTMSAIVKWNDLAFGAFPGCVTRCFTLMSRLLPPRPAKMAIYAMRCRHFLSFFLLFWVRKESWDMSGHEG